MKNEKEQQKNTLRMAMVTSFITTFMGSALNLSIPAMEAEFQVSAAMVGWVVTAYTLSVAALSVPMGKAADVTGRRRVLLTGISSFAVITVLCPLAADIRIIIVLRVLQGIAASMIFSTNNAILISVFPGSERGRVLGLSTAAVYIGLSLGPVLGGLLNHRFGWRSVFLASAAIAAAAFLFALKGAPKDSSLRTEKGKNLFDIAGSMLFIASVTLALLGLTDLTITRWGWIVLAAGVALGILFVRAELRAEDPVIRVAMFTKDREFTSSNLAALLNYGATFAISYLVSIYLQVAMGYNSQNAGLILICMPAVQAVFSPYTGRLSDRIAPYKLASLGMGFCVLGLVLFAFLQTDSSLWYVILALMVEGLGFGLFSSPNTNAVMSCVDRSEYSVANSILATMRTVGHSSSMAVVTIIVGAVLGSKGLTDVSADMLVHTMHIIFAVFVALCVLGVFFSLQRRGE